MTSLFVGITGELVKYLIKNLTELSDEWLKQYILPTLSPYQKEKLNKTGNSLDNLDLAALLRIFDNAWYEISSHNNLRTEQRHYLKEMQTIRNRWAHIDSKGINKDDQYRDLDTIQRFLVMIDANEELINNVKHSKKALITDLSLQNKSKADNPIEEKLEFVIGKEVQLKTNPEIQGVIVSIIPGEPETRMIVYRNNRKETFYESQLELIQSNSELELLSLAEFNANITALQIRQPNVNTLYSLNTARIEFIPYQFRPVLKFIRSDRPRLLIADSVGVGKTIEAGLIIKELQARQNVNSILIICPKPLIIEKKWLIEMRRFDERFTQMDGPELRYCLEEYQKDGFWIEKHNKTIIPYSLLDDDLLYGYKKNNHKHPGLLDLDPPPHFDICIVDEAHHIRNEQTANYRVVKFFCEHSETVLFLTATPIQLGNRDLYVLLNSLRPDLIINEQNFIHMSEPNAHINIAAKAVRFAQTGWQDIASKALMDAKNTSWGRTMLSSNPVVLHILNDLNKENIEPERRVQMITEIENLHTFNSIINRTRRRDIEAITIRTPETFMVEFTPEQTFIHNQLLDIQRQILSIFRNSIPLNFMMATIRRQAASCILGLVPFLEDILNRHLNEIEWDEIGNEILDYSFITNIKEQINMMIGLCKTLSEDDPKLNKLKDIIRDKQKLDNNKIMVFSSFKHTLNYLYNQFLKDNIRVAMIYGDTSDEDRIIFRNRFELDRDNPEAIDIMLFSEVGCEGLDYQFCDTIVNYDLPWNPMRIEQRIGRIDRRGQKSPKIFIYNLITEGTIDADIYTRCLYRIGIFENSIGDSEEILGEITTELKSIGENLMLTPEERNLQLQQLADNEIRKIQEEEKLEKQQFELFGIDLPNKQNDSDIEKASSYWLTPKMLEQMISIYLKKKLKKEIDYFLGEKDIKNLRLSQEARSSLLSDFQALKISQNEVSHQWELYLKGGDPNLQVTFNPSAEINNPKIVLLNPTHPLIKQAAEFFNSNNNAYTLIEVADSQFEPGSYDFALYRWQMYGLKTDLKLQTVCSSEIVGKNITQLLEKSFETTNKSYNNIMAEHWDYLDKIHYQLWLKEKEEHKMHISEQVEFLKESLRTTHKARIEFINEQIVKVTDDKIKRMHLASLRNAEADFARRMQDLEIAVEKADIIANVIMYGIIKITGE